MTSLRIGQGWDNHRIKEGRALILGGVHIPCDFGLDGHSDADILLHAITDAVLGAMALGDIGMHFPDTDPTWKGASSDQFLRQALKLAAQKGFHLVNVDSTIVLQKPKLGEYRAKIRENLARILELSLESVSVKFKTAEKVGPVGEGLSAEAQAVVLLEKR